MGKGRKIGGGGSSNSLCSASADEIMAGYTAIGKDSPLPVTGTLAASGTAADDDVLSGKTYYAGSFKNKRTGTLNASGNAEESQVLDGRLFFSNNFKVRKTGSMPNIGALDQMKSCVLSGSNVYVRMSKGAHISDTSSGYPEVFGSADAFISALGIATATNFNAAQYTSQRLQFTWAKPDRSQKMWSGIRITARQDRYPNNPDDSSYKWDSNSVYLITDVIPSGYWYITVWNYITWNNNSQRTYGGIVRQFTFNNIAISGSQNFTGSTTWRVPNAVRSIQVFLVGGGGGTSSLYSSGDNSGWCGGGGGGYTSTAYLNVNPGETLSINVGAGGSPGSDGGTSSIYRGGTQLIAAAGGKNAYDDGGNGGSGGGAGAYDNAGNGGRNGGNGEEAPWKDNPTGIGYGQGRTTHCPWDDIAYAGGGGGGSEWSSGAGRGFDGGGDGGEVSDAENGAANTGGGAGGSGHSDSIGASHGRSGGSGIVRIRW